MNRAQILARQREILMAARNENRALTEDEIREFDELQRKLEELDAREADDGQTRSIGAPAAQPAVAAPAQPATDPASEAQRAIQDERVRVSEITGLARSFGMDPAQAIADGSTIEAYRTFVLGELQKSRKPVSTGVSVTEDEADKFRAAAVDGLAMRGGVSLEKPASGAESFRGTSLRDIGIECLRRDGVNVNDLIRMSASEIYDKLGERQFYNPTAAFPAIMDQTIRKSIVELYNQVPTTFQLITTKGSLPDFKTTADHEYVIGGVGDFLLLPELLPQRKLDTYAKQFSMTRQAFINDDIGFLTRVPGLYAQAAKKTIDKQVYAILFNNSAIYDGKALFHADHHNLISTGTAPTQASIQAMILQMQKQTDTFGDPIYMTPRQLIVPVGYEFDLAVIFRSAQVTGSANNDINPLYNYPLSVVQTPMLNAMAGSNACPWFLQADASSARGIQVDYLNGQETPTVRRMETVGQLGFTWDVWLDWGIAVRDWRGFVKNPGVALA